MEISFTPELEAKLTEITSRTGRGADQVVCELVSNYLEHDQWFRSQVNKGFASLDEGKSLSHDEMAQRMRRTLSSK